MTPETPNLPLRFSTSVATRRTSCGDTANWQLRSDPAMDENQFISTAIIPCLVTKQKGWL